MPITYETVNASELNCKVAVWHITESLTELEFAYPLHSKSAAYLKKTVDEKKREWIAARLAVGHLLHQSSIIIEKDEHGKPFLKGNSMHVSVSHTKGYAAAIVHPKKSVGVDIEHYRTQTVRIKDKFLNFIEAQYPEAKELEHCHLIWGAKECLFKVYGIGELDFKEELHVEKPDNYESAIVKGFIKKTNYEAEVHFRLQPDYCLVWAF